MYKFIYVVGWCFVIIRANDMIEILTKNTTDNIILSDCADKACVEFIFVNEDEPVSIKLPNIFWKDTFLHKEWLKYSLINNINFKIEPNIAIKIWTSDVFNIGTLFDFDRQI